MRDYDFPRLPLEGIRPGTTVLLTGPHHGGTRKLGLRMLAGGVGEGAILITTNQRASRIADDCERVRRVRPPLRDVLGDDLAEGVGPHLLQRRVGVEDARGVRPALADLPDEFEAVPVGQFVLRHEAVDAVDRPDGLPGLRRRGGPPRFEPRLLQGLPRCGQVVFIGICTQYHGMNLFSRQ